MGWFQSNGVDAVPQSGFFKLYHEWMQDIINKFPPLPTPPAKLKEELHEARNKCILSKSGDFSVQIVDRIG